MSDDEIKLGRVGHYSYQQVCQTALVTKVLPKEFDSEAELPLFVNLICWEGDGDDFTRHHVPVGVTLDELSGEFHLNRECQWQK